MKIIFMGTPDFSVPALQTLIDSPHDVICVYSQPPRPKGRGMKLQKSPIHILAEENNIEVRHPKSLKKSTDEQELFDDLNADIAVVAAYGLLLPTTILNSPKYGCINIHGSLLPRWRGASPIQHAIWKGDKVSGITIMKMDIGMDTGDIILKKKTPITTDTTAQSLFDELSLMGGDMALSVLDSIEQTGKIVSEKQDETLATHCPMLKKSDGEINLESSVAEIHQQIRALNPWPGTFIIGLKGRIKILSAHIENDDLVYDLVQPEGKKPMDFKSAKNGGYL